MPVSRQLKVALVHDWLVGQGGGERVLKCFHEMWPEAPIYTLVYDETKAPAWTRECDVRTTYIQKWPGAKSHHKLLLSFMPKAWEAFDLTEYDLVISSCASCCKGVLTRPDAVHICCCYSPTRYVWDLYYEYLAGAGAIKRLFMPRMIHKVRMWDYLAAQRVDEFVVDSNFVGKRVEKFYRRQATTIYPGVRVNEQEVRDAPEDYYLVVSRFVGYKRVDIAVDACNKLGKRLIIIGSGGEDEERLRAAAGPTVEFLGRVSDEEMRNWYAGAKAFLFPGMEDYGLTPVEAMAAGVPVLAYGKGGALETVSDGRTGLFFYQQDADGLCECIERFEREGVALSRQEIHEYSKRFSEDNFTKEFRLFVDKTLETRKVQ
ncbi:glycosyltransferase [Thermophilibacter provencensis]|uniref:Glycosyltransferase n=1 Tax=Thermophilibacter provencensis TaxID=1852386 RepID=A0ABT7V4Q8_9ACTN|nr:glycosyltransferase [Thermophilibacter provencensis]MDM8271585.1 glycosyltransferase [Thermophilibacter provencensis]